MLSQKEYNARLKLYAQELEEEYFGLMVQTLNEPKYDFRNVTRRHSDFDWLGDRAELQKDAQRIRQFLNYLKTMGLLDDTKVRRLGPLNAPAADHPWRSRATEQPAMR